MKLSKKMGVKDFAVAIAKALSVEFPGGALVIGESPMKSEGELKSTGFTLKLLSPTQCVMDRLAAYYHWNDKQSLDQALLVAKHQPTRPKLHKSY